MAVKYKVRLNFNDLGETELSSEPDGLDDFNIIVTRQKELEGVFTTQGTELTFWGDGYDYLRNIIDTFGDKEPVDIKIMEAVCQDNFTVLLEGKLMLTDRVENLTSQHITLPVEDKYFSSLIDNNKNLKMFLDVNKTRNGAKFSGAAGTSFKLFDPITGTYDGTYTNGFHEITDAFSQLVNYMTEGQLGFRSDYLSDTTNWVNTDNIGGGDSFPSPKIYLVTGRRIIFGGEAPNISFLQLFRATKAIANIGMGVENDSNGDPIIRIEDKEYFFDNDNILTFREVADLLETVNKDALFAGVDMGSKDFEELDASAPPSFDQDVYPKNFKNENYSLVTSANDDSILNLVSEFITCSNAIELTKDSASFDKYHKDVFFMICDEAGDVGGGSDRLAVRSTLSGGTPYHYNDMLTNDEIAKRHFGSIPNSMAKYTGDGNDLFRAEATAIHAFNTRQFNNAGVQTIGRVKFDDDSTNPNFDTNNNFDIPGRYYTIPSNGDYTFSTNVRIRLTPNDTTPPNIGDNVYKITVSIVQSTNNLQIEQKESQQIQVVLSENSSQNRDLQVNVQAQFTDLASNERVYVEVNIECLENNYDEEIHVKSGSVFECLSTDTDTGVFETFDPNDIRPNEYEFNDSVALSDFKSFLDDKKSKIIVNHCEQKLSDKECWVEEITYNITTQQAELKAFN